MHSRHHNDVYFVARNMPRKGHVHGHVLLSLAPGERSGVQAGAFLFAKSNNCLECYLVKDRGSFKTATDPKTASEVLTFPSGALAIYSYTWRICIPPKFDLIYEGLTRNLSKS